MKKKTRVSREMKTPSFGNNSGPDDHFSIFKSNERREKVLDSTKDPKNVYKTSSKDPIYNVNQSKNADMVKEVDYITFNKKNNPETKSAVLDASLPSVQEENLVQYASKMGHKKAAQRMKKPSGGSGKSATTQYLKTRNNRVQANQLRTFIDTHNYDKIEVPDTLPTIPQEPEFYSRQESNLSKSQAR